MNTNQALSVLACVLAVLCMVCRTGVHAQCVAAGGRPMQKWSLQAAKVDVFRRMGILENTGRIGNLCDIMNLDKARLWPVWREILEKQLFVAYAQTKRHEFQISASNTKIHTITVFNYTKETYNYLESMRMRFGKNRLPVSGMIDISIQIGENCGCFIEYIRMLCRVFKGEMLIFDKFGIYRNIHHIYCREHIPNRTRKKTKVYFSDVRIQIYTTKTAEQIQENLLLMGGEVLKHGWLTARNRLSLEIEVSPLASHNIMACMVSKDPMIERLNITDDYMRYNGHYLPCRAIERLIIHHYYFLDSMTNRTDADYFIQLCRHVSQTITIKCSWYGNYLLDTPEIEKTGQASEPSQGQRAAAHNRGPLQTYTVEMAPVYSITQVEFDIRMQWINMLIMQLDRPIKRIEIKIKEVLMSRTVNFSAQVHTLMDKGCQHLAPGRDRAQASIHWFVGPSEHIPNQG